MNAYRSDSEGKLAHGVERGRAAVEELFDELRDRSTGCPVLGEGGNLLLGGDLAGDEEPEKSFGERLIAARGLGKQLLALRDGLATETDTLLCTSVGTSKYSTEQGAYRGREQSPPKSEREVHAYH